NFGLLTLDSADQISNIAAFDVTTLDLYQYPFRLTAGVINEVDHAVYPFVAAFLALPATRFTTLWPGLDQRQCPPLELIAATCCQSPCIVYVLRQADYLILRVRVHIVEPIFVHGGCHRRDVDPDPATAQPLRCDNRSPTTSERIEHQIAGVAASLDYPL